MELEDMLSNALIELAGQFERDTRPYQAGLKELENTLLKKFAQKTRTYTLKLLNRNRARPSNPNLSR